MNLSLLGAFLGGVLTLLSPCSVMLLPAFFAYAFSSPGALLARTGVFFAGLATALVPLGMLAGTLGAWVNRFRFELVMVAAIVVILLGLVMMLGVRLPGIVPQRGAQSASVASVFALGTVYGLAGVCAGPMLGAALTFAAFGGDALFGALVLLVFALQLFIAMCRRELSPRDKAPTSTLLSAGENGAEYISLSAVDALVQRHCRANQRIKECESTVIPMQSGVSVSLRLQVLPDTVIPELAAQLQQSLKEYIETISGITVTGVDILILPLAQPKAPKTM